MVDGMRATNLIGAGPSLTTAPTNSSMYRVQLLDEHRHAKSVGQDSHQPGAERRRQPAACQLFTTYTRDSWQSSNIDDYLRSQNIGEPAKTLKLWDFNPSVGGPIARDHVWFQTTFQSNGSDTQVLGSFYDADPSPFAYRADPSRPRSTRSAATASSSG